MLILIVLTIILSNVIFSKKEKVILDEVSLLNEGSKGTSFAMYYETQQEDGTYTYVESEDTTWPADLRYNAKKSGCIDYNGNKIDGTLTYNKENNKVTLRTKSATLCYLYFDLGTEENPYKIQYIEDLVDLSNKVNKGETYEEAYFTLERDLDFQQEGSYRQYDRTDYGDINGVDGTEQLMIELTNPEGTGFPPIGTGNAFDGNFNGQEFTLSNLYVNVTDMHAGLFGLVGKEDSTNTIKNLTITGNVNKKGTTGHASGLVASSSANSIIIDNVHNKVNVTIEDTTKFAAGILGYSENSAKFINSDNSGNISGGEVAAGIMAKTEGKGKIEVDTCSNTGNITTASINTGGIVGQVSGTITIEKSTNYGTITSNLGLHIGGLLGCDSSTTSNTTISKSHNYGQIKIENNEATTASYVGGLMGRSYGTLTIEESSNEIKTDNDEAGINVIYHGTKEVAVGGLIGTEHDKTKTINNSYNTSNISVESEATSGDGTQVGGIIGRQATASTIGTYTNNYNTGKIDVTTTGTIPTRVGGIIGYKSNGELTIDNNYNEGIININVKASISTGGIIGSITDNATPEMTKIVNSHNTGEINSKNTENFLNHVGGIIGDVANFGISEILRIENNYNTGNINGGTRTGGIVGDVSTNSKILINKCYNTGNVTGQEDTKYTLSVVVGGIVAHIWENSVSYILNSYNTGILTAKAANTVNYVYGFGLINYNTNPVLSVVINSFNLGNIISKDRGASVSSINKSNNLTINNVYNAGNIEGNPKYSVITNYSTGSVDIQNTYYKEISGIAESNTGDILGAYPITEANMKITDVNNINGLLYKLNNNVQTLNNQGLATYSEDLKDYTLVDWITDSTTGYPTLNFKLEGNE